MHHRFDLALGLVVLQRRACDRSVDLVSIDECRNGDKTGRLDFFVELFLDALIDDNGVIGLVLDCAKVSLCLRCRSMDRRS